MRSLSLAEIRERSFDGKQYREGETSPHFPNHNVKTLIPQYVNRGWKDGSSVALREFDQFLREGS